METAPRRSVQEREGEKQQLHLHPGDEGRRKDLQEEGEPLISFLTI